MPSLKRKRTVITANNGTSTASQISRNTVDDIFRRHFEAKFGAVNLKPIRSSGDTKSSKSAKKEADIDDSERYEDGTEGDWEESGEEDETPTNPSQPEVIEYNFAARRPASLTKPTRKDFMSSKPPSSISTSISNTKPTASSANDDSTEQVNLKHDVALQNLLRESHLLDASTLTHSSGKNRHLAIESRVQSLGGTPIRQLDGSLSRIPMRIRKGMNAKAAKREEKRRRVAKENGIVLERKGGKPKKGERKRDSGVGNPRVGRFKKGALVLSRKDLNDIHRR